MIEDPEFWKSFGTWGGAIIAIIATLLLNARQIGAFLKSVFERKEQRREQEERRQAELEDMLVQNGRQAKETLLGLYDRLYQQAREERAQLEKQWRLDRTEMQMALQETQAQQGRLHSVTLDAVEACTKSLIQVAEQMGNYTGIVKAQTQTMIEVKEAIIGQKTVTEQLGFVLSQLTFWLSQEEGLPVSTPVQLAIERTEKPAGKRK